MNNKTVTIIYLIALVVFLNIGIECNAHSGRTDNLGGHYVRTAGHGYEVGTYHYHSGPYAGHTVSKKGDVPAAFKPSSNNHQSSGSSVIGNNYSFNKITYAVILLVLGYIGFLAITGGFSKKNTDK